MLILENLRLLQSLMTRFLSIIVFSNSPQYTILHSKRTGNPTILIG